MEDRPSHSPLSKDDAGDGLPGPDSNANIERVDTTTDQSPSKAAHVAHLLDLALPSGSPPLHRDLFVQSAFSAAPASKPVARLEVNIHSTPEKVQKYFSNFGNRAYSSKRVNAVVKERRGSGECIIAYKIQGDGVRRSRAGALLNAR